VTNFITVNFAAQLLLYNYTQEGRKQERKKERKAGKNVKYIKRVVTFLGFTSGKLFFFGQFSIFRCVNNHCFSLLISEFFVIIKHENYFQLTT